MKNADLITAASMAAEAYSDVAQIPGFEVTNYIHENIQWFAARRDKDLWVVFRGTDELEDWMANLDAAKHNAGRWCVHDGFNHALNAVWPSVIEEIISHRDGNLYFAGHSLGGALAALAASRLIFGHWCPRMNLITFGQPRCGDSKWAQEMDTMLCDRYTRVYNAGDIVPHVPSRFRFSHAGREIFFDDHGILTPPTYRRRVLAAMDAALTQLFPSVLGFGAHSMEQYRKNVLGSFGDGD